MSKTVKELRKIFESNVSSDTKKLTVKELREKFEKGDFSFNEEWHKEDHNPITGLIYRAIQSIKMLHDSKQWNNKTHPMNPKIKDKFDEINTLFSLFEARKQCQIGDELVKENFIEIIVYYLEIYIFEKSNYVLDNYDLECFENILNLCKRFSETSRKFCLRICEFEVAQLMMHFLKKYQQKMQLEQSSEWSILAATAILRNCAQYDQNREFYESSDVVKTIEWFTDKSSSQKRISTVNESVDNGQNNSESWTDDQVLDWMKENNFFFRSNMELMDGKTLKFLKRLKVEAPEFFYRCLSENLGLQNVKDYMEFTKALDKLK